MNWQVDAAIASIVSAMAVVTSTIFLVVQLRQAARERYFEITAHLFQIWQSTEFQEDQLFLLHKLPASTWEEFVANGRGERAERALHRVGGFYDRIGSLIRRKLIRDEDMLPTIGGVAIAVWQRIEPFVVEARRRENAFLFQNFEAMLPECRECYVPVSTDTAATPVKDVDLIEPDEARQGCNHLLHLTARGEQRPCGAFTQISGSEYGQSPARRPRRLAGRRLP